METGLSLAMSETTKTGFVATRPRYEALPIVYLFFKRFKKHEHDDKILIVI